MNYNTSRKQLVLPEYGRSIHEMVDHALTIEDRDQRNKAARTIVKLMAQMNPQMRDLEDFKNKLWDHLIIMSNYNLDIDSPFPIPSREKVESKPSTVNYPSGKIKYRYYGKSIEHLIEEVVSEEDQDKKASMALILANLMKRLYLTWNRDSVDDEVIWGHIVELSNNQIDVPPNMELKGSSEILRSNKPKNGSFGKKRNQSQRNSKSNKRRNHK